MRSRDPMIVLLLVTGLSMASVEAFAEPTPSSDLLLPYFEVDLTGFKKTTLFTVTNEGDQPVDVTMKVHTNWGIQMEEVQVALDPQQTRGFNLRDWFLLGELPQPDGTLAALSPRRLTHLQSALSGVQSPQDQMYYATQVLPDLAVGYITIRVEGPNRGDVLWGNFYTIDPQDDSAQGDVLVDIDPTHECHDTCFRHLLFFLEGGIFDGGTEIIVWNPGRAQPQTNPLAEIHIAGLDSVVRDLDGEVVATASQDLLATQTVTLEEVAELLQAGSVRLETRGNFGNQPLQSFIGIRYGAEQRYSATLQSWCLPLETQGTTDRIGVDIEKSTNGEDADQPTGPRIPVGDPVSWEYLVRNTGTVELLNVTVTDDQGVAVTCPLTTLAPGQAMTCTGSGVAELGQYANVGSVSALDSIGRTASDSDPSHYLGFDEEIAIDIEKSTNGEDADQPTGPEIEVGQPVEWTYVVRNIGQTTLSHVTVTDDREGPVSCPKNVLDPQESMVCSKQGVAALGQYANLATATGTDDRNRTATDRDPSHYLGAPEPPIGVDIEKATNGHDADTAPGPELRVGSKVTWTYRVENTGNVTLFDVTVTDNREGSISCPKTTLAAGESMLCMEEGVAELGPYSNRATVRGEDERNRTATDQDPSHYVGVPLPPIGIDIEKATNGHDADTPTGPEILVGSSVTWTYVVTNTGDVTLSSVAVTDDREGSISCPKTTLAAGESMTCTEHGTAQEGQYANLATVTGRAADDREASDSDPSHYLGILPPIGIDIEKATNGHDADSPFGPKIAVGSTVTWTYVVTNTGNVTLFDVAVTDDKEGSISCPKSTLAAGESMTCTEHGTAQSGHYSNLGTVGARDDFSRTVSDSDPSHYKGIEVCLPKLTFDKDPYGNKLRTGERVTDQWASQGIHITTSSPSHHPAMIFNSSSPTGGDYDLGTPNRDFGGPGIGSGGERGRSGENRLARGKILIISEDNNPDDPDDNESGGTMIFTFDQPTRIDAVQLLDIDDASERGTVKAYDGNGQLLVSRTMVAVGNNGYQTLSVGATNARRLEVHFPKSGGLPGIVFCAD